MLYSLLHYPAKLALLIWCRHIKINNKNILKYNGPLLIAANHPNSFLDAILLCALFKQPIYSLARGDVFKNKTVAKILHSLKMFPVYRVSEGVQNLEENYKTFADCIEVFKQNGIVLIFSEGRCVNEWQLRPLKKGTARLAIAAWEQGIPLQVIPLGINYQSFTSFGKNIILNFGDAICSSIINVFDSNTQGANIQKFNEGLKLQLQQLVFEIPSSFKLKIVKTFIARNNAIKIILLFIPAFLGYILHAPLYIPIQKFCYSKFSKIDHYDSVMVGMLFLLYPIYLLLFAVGLFLCTNNYFSFFSLVVLPSFAWSFVQLKKQF